LGVQVVVILILKVHELLQSHNEQLFRLPLLLLLLLEVNNQEEAQKHLGEADELLVHFLS